MRNAIMALWVVPVLIIVFILVISLSAHQAPIQTQTQTPTPTLTPSPTPLHTTAITPTPKATGGITNADIAGASSLKFSIDVTSGGVKQGTYTYMAKNAGTNNLMLRIEITDTSGTTSIYIFNGAQQKAWTYGGTQWTDISAAYSSQFSTWYASFAGYQNSLASWTGAGDLTYSAPNGDSVRYYNIAVNPNLADSLFQHTQTSTLTPKPIATPTPTPNPTPTPTPTANLTYNLTGHSRNYPTDVLFNVSVTGTITNIGTKTATNIHLEVQVTHSGTLVYDQTFALPNISAGATYTVNIPESATKAAGRNYSYSDGVSPPHYVFALTWG